MPLDVRTERWIKASINKHFDTGKGAHTLILEGDALPLSSPSWCEVRINGPRFHEVSKDFYLTDLEINLAFNVQLAHADNLYKMETLVGHFRALCENQINIKKYADGDALINCLRLRDTVSNPIEVIPWGEVSVQGNSGPVRVFMTTLDGYYELEIDNDN